MHSKIYVTPRSVTKNMPASLKKLEEAGYELIYAPKGEQPTEEQQLEVLPNCVAYLAGAEVISRRVMEASPNLKIISRNGVGIENIDQKAAKECHIIIKTTPGANAQGVAELAIALMLSAARSIPLSNTHMKQGEWKREKAYELQNKTLGVIGTGNIGKRVAQMALGIGMNVLGYDLYPNTTFHPSDKFQYTDLNSLVSNSNVISLHCPPSDAPIMNREVIQNVKDDTIIVNTAREGVVDEDAIYEGLESGKLMCYATDVYKTEPPEMNRLIKHPRCICTPHIGGYTEESINNALEAAVDNILEVLKE